MVSSGYVENDGSGGGGDPGDGETPVENVDAQPESPDEGDKAKEAATPGPDYKVGRQTWTDVMQE